MSDLNSLFNLNKNEGPIIIVSAGHSGSRFLADVLSKNGIYIGSRVNKNTLDSIDWAKFGIDLISSDFFPNWNKELETEEFQEFCEKELKKTLKKFLKDKKNEKIWGWKGTVLFIMPVIKKYFPNAKFIHLIRDGRDVTLSDKGRLELPFDYSLLSKNPLRIVKNIFSLFKRNKINRYRLNIFFNNSQIKEWKNIHLNKNNILKNKYLFQMQLWKNNVETARKYGKNLKKDYYEIRYENLCENPSKEVKKLFSYLNIKIKPELKCFVENKASVKSIGKWKNLDKLNLSEEEKKDFDNALNSGTPLLKKLGYIEKGKI